MGSKVKAIVLLGAAVCIVGALHFLVFAPKKVQWDNYNKRLGELSNTYKSIVSNISAEKTEAAENQPLVSEVDQVIKVIKEKIQSARTGFDDLDKKLKIIERYDPSINYRDEIISQIERMRQMEATSNATKLTISRSWDVDGGLVEGRFGTGFNASGGRSMTYANTKSKSLILPKQGTVEFFVKPDWDPSDTDVHHKCLFMAIDSRKFTRDKITEMLEAEQANAEKENAGNSMFERMSGQNLQQMLAGQQGPFNRDCFVAIYKGEGPTLTFEMRDYVKTPSMLTAYISDWKKGQWYYITATWEPKRQALYINGSNRGVPLGGGGPSIRESRDVEDDLLLSGGGGGYGMGMMGMGGMGMMGMGGMGMMGMGGMGMMGMGGMGGMMGGGFSSSMGPTTGSALTMGIAIPTTLTGIYLGTDEAGGFAADCSFDDLRIQNRSTASPSPSSELQKNENTLLLDHFNDELPEPEDLPILLTELAQVQRQKNVGTLNPVIKEYYENNYTLLKQSLGINEEFLKADPTTRTIRELYCLDYIRKNTNRDFAELVDLLQLDREILKNDSKLLHRIVEFQILCYDLAKQAMDDQIISINKIVYKGHGYNVSDKELEDSFKGDREELRLDLMGENNILVKYDWGGGGMGGYGMGMMGGGMGMMPGMGMGGMGMGGMGMMGMMGGMGGMGSGLLGMFRGVGTSDVEIRQKAMMLGELFWTSQIEKLPEGKKVDDKLTIEDKIVLVRQIIDMIEKYKTYQKYAKDGLIPPEVTEAFNKDMEDSQKDYYIKRSLTMDLDTSYNSLMKYMYDIEYGPRVQTINAINIKNKENEIVNVLMDVESHTLKNPAEEEKAKEEGQDEGNPEGKKQAKTTETTGGVSMR